MLVYSNIINNTIFLTPIFIELQIPLPQPKPPANA